MRRQKKDKRSHLNFGNSLIVETKEKNFNDLNRFTFLISWIAGICSCCFLGIYQPFMRLWAGDDLLLPFSAVICLVVYYYIYEINQLLNLYKDAGGIWHEDRFRPLVTAIANVSMNLIMVQFWGIYGVLLSTVLSKTFWERTMLAVSRQRTSSFTIQIGILLSLTNTTSYLSKMEI